jgi:beta-lactamase regulating signal transducer with metallopeptidase domain
MAALMLYSLVVASLVAGAARGLEASGWGRHSGRSRWLWAGCVVAILGVTGWGAVAPLTQAPDAPATGSGGLEVSVTPASGPAAVWPTVAVPAPPAPDLDPILARLWLAFSLVTVASLGVAGLRMHRRRRHWVRTDVGDDEVWVSDDTGPGVVGLLSPRVVVPRWVTALPPTDRSLVLQHEQAHIAARDPYLLAVGLTALVIVPWNPVVWWAVARLRAAVEVDCDRRVLRRSPDPVDYARLLVDVGQRRLRIPVGIAAFTRSPSLLERRIRTMLEPTPRRPVRTAVLSLLAVALVVGACSVERPSTPTELVDPVQADNEAGLFDGAPFAVSLRVDGNVVVGSVSDPETGEGIGNVQVFAPTLNVGTLSNMQGRFLLVNVPPGTHGLEFATRGGADTLRVVVSVDELTPEQEAAMREAREQQRAAVEAARAAGREVLPPAPGDQRVEVKPAFARADSSNPEVWRQLRSAMDRLRNEGPPPPVNAETYGALYITAADRTTGAAIEGLRIYLPELEIGTITNDEGGAILIRIPPGTWKVQVAPPGADFLEIPFVKEVEKGRTAVMELNVTGG